MTTEAPSTTSQAGRSSSGRLPSYSDVGTQLALALCGGGSECPWYGTDHQRGIAVGKTIHWRERRPTRRGLRQFLKLAAVVTMPDANRGTRFERLYWQNVEAERLAKIVGVRFLRDLADGDRAKVRFWLESYFSKAHKPIQRDLLRRIRRWARA